MPSIPDPPRPDEATLVALACELGWPSDAHWVWIASVGPISTAAPHIAVHVEGRTHIPSRGFVRWVAPEPLLFAPASFLGWDGYRFELAGRPVDQEPPSPRLPIWRLDYHGGRDPADPDDQPGSLIVPLWRQRAYYQDSPLFAELQWRPGEPEARPYIGGWDAAPTGRALDRAVGHARRGLPFLRQVQDIIGSRGRPLLEDTPAFRPTVERIAQARRAGKPWATIACDLGIPERRARDWWKRACKLGWYS